MDILKTITSALACTKETLLTTITNTKENICDFFSEETTVTRKTIAIICIIAALIGIVYGFLLSPIKRGIHVNVINSGSSYDEDEDEDWE